MRTHDDHASMRAALAWCLLGPALAQLVINVSRGREDSVPFRQSIAGNTTGETVTIEYVTPGGIGVTQLADFRTGVTVTVVTVPGEEDLGQARYQVFCFLSVSTSDMIPPEAITKLRQKHPGTVRVAEESRGSTVVEHPVSLVVARAGHLSRHLPRLCREARDTTFAPSALVAAAREGSLARSGGGPAPVEEAAWVRGDASQGWADKERCAKAGPGEPCLCSLDHCLHWFPCSLKYCRNVSGEGEHRCGIRTCSKCTKLRFLSTSSQFCTWDEL